ncbi:uncharacterized protein LOC113470221 [Diaphorina citri]|uniref:Uncharacterized protein LOC113470221 n=1 Tax=Diaphorina citri TaxID=121845 RepID=A0A3Q0JC45_DIACI|nr:uncharacterized protein LOC113470221 [Diaphorina citri]
MYNLSALLYQDSSSNGNYRTMAVVKDGQPFIKDFKSLKSKKACFSQYQSLAWVSFLNVTNSFKLLPKKCGYTKAAASFLAGACLPGLKRSNETQPESLCYSCKAGEYPLILAKVRHTGIRTQEFRQKSPPISK